MHPTMQNHITQQIGREATCDTQAFQKTNHNLTNQRLGVDCLHKMNSKKTRTRAHHNSIKTQNEKSKIWRGLPARNELETIHIQKIYSQVCHLQCHVSQGFCNNQQMEHNNKRSMPNATLIHDSIVGHEKTKCAKKSNP